MNLLRKRYDISKNIWPYIRNFKKEWILLLILKIGQSVPILLFPLIFKIFIDRVIEKKNFSFMIYIVLLYISVYIIETIMKVLHRYIDNKVFNRVTFVLQKQMLKKYLFMDINKLQDYKISDLNQRINKDIDIIKFFLIGQVFDYGTTIINLINISIILVFLDYRMAIIIYLLIPISFYIYNKLNSYMQNIYNERKELDIFIDQWLLNIFNSWKQVKINCLENNRTLEYHKILEHRFDNQKKEINCKFKKEAFFETKSLLIDQLFLYFIGGALYLVVNISIGTILSCIQYYNEITLSIKKILDIDNNLMWMKPSIDRVIEILNINIEENGLLLNDVKKYDLVYEIKNLNFKYNKNDKYILKNINIKIKYGEKIIIDGFSGCGKSTLIKILIKKIINYKGEIYFKNKNLKEINSNEIYKYIRVINQENYFMNLTIKEYLLLSKFDASNDELINACEKVNLLTYINKLENGFNTKIGENGSFLSEGQKQKLAIARLFLINDKTIILDEAFSAIDGDDKEKILSNLLEHFKKETIICISHDIKVKKYFDKCFFLNK